MQFGDNASLLRKKNVARHSQARNDWVMYRKQDAAFDTLPTTSGDISGGSIAAH